MAEIFLSYRRADAAAAAGRLYDALVRNFGAAQVFRDLDSIEAGEDFEHRIRGALADAVAGLVVIGPDALIQETNADPLKNDDLYVRLDSRDCFTIARMTGYVHASSCMEFETKQFPTHRPPREDRER